jgi:hypothetical protein
MKRISSSLTLWWYKRLGPALLGVGFVLTAVASAVLVARGTITPLWLVAPVLLAIVTFLYLRRFVFPLADEVFDDGDTLLVRHGKRTTRLPLAEIESVHYSLVFDPPRIVLQTVLPDTTRITFMPYLFAGVCFFRPHPLLADLRARIGTGPSTQD